MFETSSNLWSAESSLPPRIETRQTVLTPGRNTPAQIWHRTMTFIALGLSSVIPVAHIILSKGLQRAREEAAVDWLAGGGVW